jgi:hypothetical protein
MYRDIPSGAAMFPSSTDGDGYVESPKVDFVFPVEVYVDCTPMTEEESFILAWTLNHIYWKDMSLNLYVDGSAAVSDTDKNPPAEMRDEIERGARWILSLMRS